MKNHTRRPRSEYEALYQRKLTERLTYAALSEDCGVPVATLQYWFRRFKAKSPAPEPQHNEERRDGDFVRIAVESPLDDAVDVVLGDNVRLRVHAGFNEQTLLRLVQLLGC